MSNENRYMAGYLKVCWCTPMVNDCAHGEREKWFSPLMKHTRMKEQMCTAVDMKKEKKVSVRSCTTTMLAHIKHKSCRNTWKNMGFRPWCTPPLYSPDLAPCDFWLFSTIKRVVYDKSAGHQPDTCHSEWADIRRILEDHPCQIDQMDGTLPRQPWRDFEKEWVTEEDTESEDNESVNMTNKVVFS